MSLRKLINRRRNGIPSGFVECAVNALGGDSSKFSRQATQDTEEFDWETLDDNTIINWDEFILTLGKISSLKRDRALLPSEFRSGGCLLHDAITLGAPDDGESDAHSHTCTIMTSYKLTYAAYAVLMYICERFPECIRDEDKDGRFSLHVACSYGCSPEFISHLVNMHAPSVSMRDSLGKTPFHHLCQSYMSPKHKASKTTIKKMKQCLWILYRKAPGSIIVEDQSGIDPIEYALESNLDMSFIRDLQNMISRYHANEAKKESHRRCMQNRRQLDKKHSPHAAFAA